MPSLPVAAVKLRADSAQPAAYYQRLAVDDLILAVEDEIDDQNQGAKTSYASIYFMF